MRPPQRCLGRGHHVAGLGPRVLDDAGVGLLGHGAAGVGLAAGQQQPRPGLVVLRVHILHEGAHADGRGTGDGRGLDGDVVSAYLPGIQ